MAERSHRPSVSVITIVFAWLFVFATIGYPMVGLISATAGLPSTVLSYPFRALVVALSLLLASLALKYPNSNRFDGLILLFWVLCLARFSVDILISGVPGAEFAFVFFALTILIPCTVLMISAWAINEEYMATVFFSVGSVICFSGVVMHFLGIGLSTSLTEETGRLTFESINPIALGHVGVSTIIAAVSLLNSKKLVLIRPLLMLGIGFAATCMILSGSRGPLLALLFCLTFFAVRRGYLKLLIAGLLFAGLYVARLLSQGSTIELYTRFSNISEDQSALERLLIQVNALDQFLNSPWLGSAYIELSTGFIPHNMLLESAMALGTFGAILFLILSFRGLRHGFEQSKSGSLFIPMIYIQSLINSQLSGSLWQSADFWACIILLSSSASIRKNVLIGNRMKARVV